MHTHTQASIEPSLACHNSRCFILQVLVEDATGQLDAVMAGPDVEGFFGPLVPPHLWACDQGTDIQRKAGLMEAAFQWLETGGRMTSAWSLQAQISGEATLEGKAGRGAGMSVWPVEAPLLLCACWRGRWKPLLLCACRRGRWKPLCFCVLVGVAGGSLSASVCLSAWPVEAPASVCLSVWPVEAPLLLCA